MGIEKPYEVETGKLHGAPAAPHRVPIEARVRELIRPSAYGVVIAGRALEAPSGDPERAARELRALVTHRMEDRRPNADDHAWRRFEAIVRGIVRDRRYADYDLAWTLLEAVDGL